MTWGKSIRMDQVITQILNILVEPPGNLIYSTIIIFSIMMALQSAVVQLGKISPPTGRRLVSGLASVLLCQLIVFIASALGWQKLIDYQWIMPVLDRSMSWITIAILFWLWVFPQKNSVGDTLSSGLCVFGLIYLFSGLLYWAQLAGILHFNQTALDFSWAAGLGLLSITAMVILVIQKPALWNIGFGFFLMIGAGAVGHLVWSNPDSDISAVFRLAQIGVYPLIPMLSQRLPLKTSVIAQPFLEQSASDIAKLNSPSNSKSTAAWLRLAGLQDLQGIESLITEGISRSVNADIVLFLTREDLTGPLTISGGFNLLRETSIERAVIDHTQIPQISAALQRKNILQISNKNGNSPADFNTLCLVLGVNEIGSLLLVPVEIDSFIGSGFLLISPCSKREWNTDDLNFLDSISPDIGKAFDSTKQRLNLAFQNKAMRAEIENLTQSLPQSEDVQQNRIFPDNSLPGAGFNSRNMSAREIILKLEAENNSLREVLQDFSTNEKFAQPAPKTTFLDEGVKNSLEATTQEIRQSTSSIHGLTDLLINKPTDTLSVLQIKILQRIQNASDRVNTLLDGFFDEVATRNSNSNLKISSSNLGEVVADVINTLSELLKEKDIAVEIDIPENLAQVSMEREVLHQIIIHVLQNSLKITPPSVDLELYARLKQNNHEANFINFQVTKNDENFSQKRASTLESTLISNESPTNSETVEPWTGFLTTQTLIESRGGKLWVENSSGEPPSIKLLLPIIPMRSNGNQFQK